MRHTAICCAAAAALAAGSAVLPAWADDVTMTYGWSRTDGFGCRCFGFGTSGTLAVSGGVPVLFGAGLAPAGAIAVVTTPPPAPAAPPAAPPAPMKIITAPAAQ